MNRSRTRFEHLSCLVAAVMALAACDAARERELPASVERISGSTAKGAVPAQAGRDPSASDPIPASLPPRISADSLSDRVITVRIKSALRAEPGMAGADVSVTTSHGAVVLNGTVKSYEQAGIASAAAQRQDGVMRVDNQLSLLLQ